MQRQPPDAVDGGRSSNGSRTSSSPRSLSQRQRRPVRGLNSCSCQPSPKPTSGRVGRRVELLDRDACAGASPSTVDRRVVEAAPAASDRPAAARTRGTRPGDQRARRISAIRRRRPSDAGAQRRIEVAAADHQRAADRRRREIQPSIGATRRARADPRRRRRPLPASAPTLRRRTTRADRRDTSPSRSAARRSSSTGYGSGQR